MADDSVAEGEKSRWLQPAKDQSSAAIIQLDAIHTSEEKPGEREREREAVGEVIENPMYSCRNRPPNALCFSLPSALLVHTCPCHRTIS